MSLDWPSVWAAKSSKFLRKSKDVRIVRGRTFLEESLKLHLEWASAWSAKCKDFIRKSRVFRTVGGAHFWRNR